MSEPIGEPSIDEAYQQRLAKDYEQACAARKAHFDRLHELNINTVVITYDFCSDSGPVENVTAFDASNQKVQLPKELDDELTQLAVTLLQFGWEINDSAFGRFVFGVPQRELLREHNWRTVVTESESVTWQVCTPKPRRRVNRDPSNN